MKKTLLLFVLSIGIMGVTFGQQVTCKGQCVTCEGSTANGQNASVIGPNNQANAINSIVIGKNSVADAWHSIVIGNYSSTLSTGVNSITIGRYASVTTGLSMVIGYGVSSDNRLVNNMQQSLMMGFNSNRPTLFISNSNGLGKSGSIAIGDVVDEDGQMDPQAKLHLRADEGEEAAVFIEPHSWAEGDSAVLYLGNKQNSVSANTEDGLVYTSQKNHIFKGGDVFIEDIDKGIIMKSPDGKCWRGTLDNNGNLNFTQLAACPGITTYIPEKNKPVNNQVKLYPNPAGDFITVTVKNYNGLTATMIDANGRVVASKRFQASNVRFYIGDMSAGNYIMHITGNGLNVSKRFVKSK